MSTGRGARSSCFLRRGDGKGPVAYRYLSAVVSCERFPRKQHLSGAGYVSEMGAERTSLRALWIGYSGLYVGREVTGHFSRVFRRDGYSTTVVHRLFVLVLSGVVGFAQHKQAGKKNGQNKGVDDT